MQDRLSIQLVRYSSFIIILHTKAYIITWYIFLPDSEYCLLMDPKEVWGREGCSGAFRLRAEGTKIWADWGFWYFSLFSSEGIIFLFADIKESVLERLSRGILCIGGALCVNDVASLRSESPKLQVLLFMLHVDLDFSIVDCSLILLQVGEWLEIGASRWYRNKYFYFSIHLF